MKIYFVTGNPRKFKEAVEALRPHGIDVEQINIGKPEPLHEEDIEAVARFAAKKLAHDLQKTIVCEDTGIYMDAYTNFPGPHSKWVYKTIGYEGILKLLEGKDRSMTFRTAVAYCEPGKEPKLFIGENHGSVSGEVHCQHLDLDNVPYDRVFIPEGYTEVFGTFAPELKRELSSRGRAFTQLAEYLKHERH